MKLHNVDTVYLPYTYTRLILMCPWLPAPLIRLFFWGHPLTRLFVWGAPDRLPHLPNPVHGICLLHFLSSRHSFLNVSSLLFTLHISGLRRTGVRFWIRFLIRIRNRIQIRPKIEQIPIFFFLIFFCIRFKTNNDVFLL